MSVVGARPQFIKAAPVCAAFAAAGIDEILVHTGQHFDAEMSEVFFSELGIPAPRHNLDIHGGGHGEMTGRMLAALERLVMDESPDLVLVYGDTNSTLAAALAAAKLHVPVAHVEAGLRSFNRAMPEEINRVLTDHVSALLFCPTDDAVRHLAREGITEGVSQVGDVMYDAALMARARGVESGTRERLGLPAGGYHVLTVHRAENTGSAEQLRAILDYVAAAVEGAPVVLPVHPRVREMVTGLDLGFTGLHRVDPVPYLDMADLLANARSVFTDSGGLQKECYFHRVPCVTLRSETEWRETIDAGWNRLWTDADYAGERRDIADYGSGDAAPRIAAAVRAFLER